MTPPPDDPAGTPPKTQFIRVGPSTPPEPPAASPSPPRKAAPAQGNPPPPRRAAQAAANDDDTSHPISRGQKSPLTSMLRVETAKSTRMGAVVVLLGVAVLSLLAVVALLTAMLLREG